MEILVSAQNVVVDHRSTLLDAAVSVNSAAATSAEMMLSSKQNRLLWMSLPTNRMRVALDLLVRLIVLPLMSGVSRGLHRIRGIGLLINGHNVQHSRRLLASLLAYAANTMSRNLSTVQVVHRIDPLLRLMKLRRVAAPKAAAAALPTLAISHDRTADVALCDSPTAGSISGEAGGGAAIAAAPAADTLLTLRQSVPEPPEPERCVTLNVLAAPPVGTPIRADVVFIHGLHGSLVNTWKQGLWSSAGRRVPFQRPPRPPIRPPKRQRHSRGSLFEQPPHRSKRQKFAERSFSCPASPGDVLDVDSSFDSYLATAWEERRRRQQRRPTDDSDSLANGWTSPGASRSSSSGNGTDMESSSDSEMGGDFEASTVTMELEQQFPAFRLRDEAHTESTVPEDDDGADRVAGPAQSQPTDGNDDNRNGGGDIISDNDRGDGGYSRCWPGDWLPLDCPGVRVIAVNYSTDPYLWRPLWIRKRHRTTLAQRSREMTELLTEHGVGVGRPIVWVGHSKGGIFIKQIMVDAWESGKATVAPLWRSARGCVFYSVPHRGSPLADFNLPLVRQSVELVEIKKNCPGVLELHRRFVALYRGGYLRLQIFSFVETALTLMSVLYLRIVGIDSADPGIGDVCGVHLDHREICKPRDRNCILYTKLRNMINQVS